MAAISYSTLLAQILTVLRNADALQGAHVTDEPDYPTAEQCPAVQVAFVGFTRVRRRIVARAAAGMPYDETIHFAVRCTAFSGQSAADARRQRDELVQAVEAILDDVPTLGNLVQQMDVLAGEAGDRTAENGSMYAELTLRLELFALT